MNDYMSNLKYIDHPYVQESKQLASESGDLEKEVKLPYVMKDKLLMSPGVWNNFFYTEASLVTAFENTDWEDGEVRALFLDHKDREAREWVGEVRNPHMVDGDLIGDLHIVDKGTAIKLAFGAKMGISPKVTGEEENGKMMSYLYDNFSVVINPAVKRAYINNSEMEEGELAGLDPKAKVKNRGDVVLGSEAITVKDSKDHFPINNIRQARNALARVAQFESSPSWYEGSLADLQTLVRKAVKNKYPSIEIKGLLEEVDNMSEEDKKVATQEMEEAPAEEPKDAPEEAKEVAKEEAPEEPAEEAKEEEPKAEELSAKEPASNDLSEFNVFAQKFMGENAEKSLGDALEAYNESKKSPVDALLSRIAVLEEQIAELKSAKNFGHDKEKEEVAKEEAAGKKMDEATPESVENSEAKDIKEVTVENSEVTQSLDKAKEADPSKRSFFMSEVDNKKSDYEMLAFLKSRQN